VVSVVEQALSEQEVNVTTVVTGVSDISSDDEDMTRDSEGNRVLMTLEGDSVVDETRDWYSDDWRA
jgi:hypothetical protein